jgi:hypothetical protein
VLRSAACAPISSKMILANCGLAEVDESQSDPHRWITSGLAVVGQNPGIESRRRNIGPMQRTRKWLKSHHREALGTIARFTA